MLQKGQLYDDERHINGHTAVSELLRQSSASTDTSGAGDEITCAAWALGSSGVPGFCMQRSLDTGTAWPYYRPESRTLRHPEDELEDAVGGGEHAARERERPRGASRPQSKRSKSDCPKLSGGRNGR